MKNEFVDFLKAHNAYDSFTKCVISSARYDGMNELLESNQMAYIAVPFSWSDTEDGIEYWAILNSKWMDIVKAKQQNENMFV